MNKRRNRGVQLTSDPLEDRKLLSSLTGLRLDHPLVGEVRAAFKLPKIPTPKLPKIPTPKLPKVDIRGTLHELAGEAGRIAYPAAAGIMSVRNGNRPPAPNHISKADQQVLSPYFGSLVSRVTVYYGVDPMDSWRAGGYTIRLGGVDSIAQTYGRDIYFKSARDSLPDYDRLKTLIHELVHSQQYEKYGSSLSNFGYNYFKKPLQSRSQLLWQ
jgi:hypothetical protein